MKLKGLMILIMPFFGLLSSCEDLLGGKTWAYFNETGCHNPWGHVEHGTTEAAVVLFLDEKDIPVYEIRTEVYSEGPFCMACTCPTGRRIHVRIRESDMKKIQKLGFKP